MDYSKVFMLFSGIFVRRISSSWSSKYMYKGRIDPLYQFSVASGYPQRSREIASQAYVKEKPFNLSCLPKKNLFFLKTHKTASTSIQNILLRYADSHNLTVALPVANNHHFFPSDKPFNQEMLENSPWKDDGYNMLCHHMNYNQEEVEYVLPYNSIFFTILRDPVAAFESFYEYQNYRELYNMTIDKFAEYTINHTAHSYFWKKGKPPQNMYLSDFGMDLKYFHNRTLINKLITSIDKRFNLVLITESYDESLILLKKELCWEIKDLIGFKNNARSPTYQNNLSEKSIQLIRKWNWGDQIVYDFFKKKFDQKLATEMKKGPQFNEELAELKSQRDNVYNTCVEKNISSSKLAEFDFWTKKVEGFKLKIHNSTCENMVKPERQFTDELRFKQLFRMVPPRLAAFMEKNLKRPGMDFAKASTIFRSLKLFMNV